MGYPGKKPIFQDIGMGKRLICLRIPGPHHQLGTVGKMRKFLSRKNDQFHFKAMACIEKPAVQNASPVVQTLSQFGQLRIHAIVGIDVHQSGADAAALAGRIFPAGQITGIELQRRSVSR